MGQFEEIEIRCINISEVLKLWENCRNSNYFTICNDYISEPNLLFGYAQSGSRSTVHCLRNFTPRQEAIHTLILIRRRRNLRNSDYDAHLMQSGLLHAPTHMIHHDPPTHHPSPAHHSPRWQIIPSAVSLGRHTQTWAGCDFLWTIAIVLERSLPWRSRIVLFLFIGFAACRIW